MVWVLIGIVIVLVLLALWAVFAYNGLIKLRNLVQEAWHQIDVELKRRHDLIPNLVETVKGYATHERGTLEEVIRARAAAVGGASTPATAAQNENVLTQALGRLMAVAEAYPDLKANQNFMALQGELSSTEDRIAAGRRYYNANVRELNTKVETVPTNIIAGFGKIGKEEYFEVDAPARNAPNVSFGAGSGAGGPGAPVGADPGSPVQPSSVEFGQAAAPTATGQPGQAPSGPYQQPQQPQTPQSPQDGPPPYGQSGPPQPGSQGPGYTPPGGNFPGGGQPPAGPPPQR
ncbi:LemA family protein [Luteipulveratus flavus]|uniref:LemA family protein n=1 Tax=Luteipulveratus flavus TaxID=3031728 RepID=A0ABT6CA53_9MICO|nr:LemA family protein [Luteipulveratus sp. YIM 133296]MDF8265675.1 LemA family protein [Luteipulveratus sp. YIM 133296]